VSDKRGSKQQFIVKCWDFRIYLAPKNFFARIVNALGPRIAPARTASEFDVQLFTEKDGEFFPIFVPELGYDRWNIS
jgi:hypothetical protein